MEACLLALFQHTCKKRKLKIKTVQDYAKTRIKDIHSLNWPWQLVESGSKGSKGQPSNSDQLPDLFGMLIEIYYQAYLGSGKQEEFREVVLSNGNTVDLAKMIYHASKSTESTVPIKIQRRSKNNQRNRPQNSIRHCSATNFVFSAEDHEHDAWLAREWLQQNGTMTTLRQIRDGLMKETVSRVSNRGVNQDFKNLKKAKENMEMVWKVFFDIALVDYPNLDIKLDQSVFRNADDSITKVMLYIHSMETFIPEQINLASSHRDESKIDTFGPYALALGCILDKAEFWRADRTKGSFNLYKGLQLKDDEISDFLNLVGELIDFAGFMSAHKKMDFAIAQAKRNTHIPMLKPVIVKIHLKEPKGFHFQMNKRDYSAYPLEQDVLLYDGLYAKIDKVEKIQKNKTEFMLIEMTYDPEAMDDEEYEEDGENSMDNSF